MRRYRRRYRQARCSQVRPAPTRFLPDFANGDTLVLKTTTGGVTTTNTLSFYTGAAPLQ